MEIKYKLDTEEGKLLFWVDGITGGPVIYADTVEEGEAKVRELMEVGNDIIMKITFVSEIDKMMLDMAYEMIETLSTAPDSQIDASITARLKDLIGKPLEEVKTEIRHIVDDCVFGGLTSGFSLIAIRGLYNILGGDDEDFRNDKINPWRKERYGK